VAASPERRQPQPNHKGENTISKTAQYLSQEEIRDAADHIVDHITGVELACRNIPQPFPEELETDEATVELRQAIEKYIARMQDEREPY
jgi:hypothetical protein